MILSTPSAIIEVKPTSSHPSLLKEIKYEQVEFAKMLHKSEIAKNIASIEANHSTIKNASYANYENVHSDFLHFSDIEKSEDNLNRSIFY